MAQRRVQLEGDEGPIRKDGPFSYARSLALRWVAKDEKSVSVSNRSTPSRFLSQPMTR